MFLITKNTHIPRSLCVVDSWSFQPLKHGNGTALSLFLTPNLRPQVSSVALGDMAGIGTEPDAGGSVTGNDLWYVVNM